MGQRFAVYNETRDVVAFYDSDLAMPPEGAQFVEITTADHHALLDSLSKGGRGYIDEDGKPQTVLPGEGDAGGGT